MTFILFFVVLAVLILAHELGHFLAAKWGGIKVEEFGLGLPPRVFGIKKGETLYSLNWLPFGGFVKIFGEDITEETLGGPDRDRSLIHKPKWLQAMVLAAGVFFNLVLAWTLLSVNLLFGLPVTITDLPAGLEIKEPVLVVVAVEPDSPAARGGLRPGDKLLTLSAGQAVANDLTAEAVGDFIKTRADREITVKYLRRADSGNSEEIALLSVVPKPDGQQGEGLIGVAMQEVGLATASWWRAPIYGLYFTSVLTGETLSGLKIFFTLLLTDSRDALKAVAGPVGIYGLVGDASRLGLVYLLNFVALISINLAVLNLLPFPALDGGRLFFVAIEAITRRPIKPVVANTLNLLGFACLILLMLAIVASDIAKLL